MVLIPAKILLGLGQGLSISGLALAMPFFFAFRTYLRFLDHLQMLYVFALVLDFHQDVFSSYLGNSWVAFNQNIYYFCTKGEFVCTVGFPLSFGSCLLVFLLIMRLIVTFQAWRKKDIRFEPVYTFFKGLTRWVYAPLSYWSVYFFIKSIKGQSTSLIPSIVILAICVIFPLVQLIGYKLIQKPQDNVWRKWLEFANFYRLLFVCGLMAVGQLLNNRIPFYVIYGVYAIYGGLFSIFHTFYFKVTGRIIFVIGQALMIAVFSFFLFKQAYIADYNLDFICVGAVIVMDILYYTVQLISYIIKGVPPEDSMQINPQLIDNDTKRGNKQKVKANPYQIGLSDVGNEINNSRQDIYIKQGLSPNVNRYKDSKNYGGRGR